MSNTLSAPFFKQVIFLVLPITLQMLLQSAMGMADVFMVSSLGQEPIAAVGLSTKLHFLLTVLMVGIATACSILIAQYYGAAQWQKCRQFLAVTLLTGSFTMLPCILLFAWNNAVWLSWINPEKPVVEIASAYLEITAVALLITQLIIIYEGALRSIGNTTVPLITVAIASTANILLNYLLIFGKWGFPELGVSGAAWATLISRIFQLSMCLFWLYWRKHEFALSIKEFIGFLTKPCIKYFVKFSFPLSVNYLIWAIGNATYHVLTGYSGTNALATMGVLVPIETAFFALFIGLSNASSVMVGHSLGAGNSQQAWRLQKIFDRITLSFGIAFCILLYLFKSTITGLFHNVEDSTIELLNQVLVFFCLLTWIKVLNMVRIIGVLRAGADNNFILLVDTLAMWGVGVPLFVVCVFWFKLPFIYVFLAMYVEDIVKLLPVYWRVKKGYWTKNLTENTVTA